jgi:hypothetical protein
MNLTVKDQKFELEFRHVTKLGKHAQLHKGSVKAVTTCVLMSGAPRFSKGLIAIDNALCVDGDNFSRREGRNRAFRKLLDHCGALRDLRVDLWEQYNRVANGVERCPYCTDGWKLGGGDPCPECFNMRTVGGTGWKGGALLVFGDRASGELIDPPKPTPVRKPAPTPEQVAAWKEAGAAKRLERQRAHGSSV